MGMLLQQPIDDKAWIAGLSGMVKSPGVIHLVPAGPEYQHVCRPSPLTGLPQEALCVLRANGSFEPMQQQ
jgi:hypothetical protein